MVIGDKYLAAISPTEYEGWYRGQVDFDDGSGGFDFFGADIDSLREEGEKSLKVWLEVNKEKEMEEDKIFCRECERPISQMYFGHDLVNNCGNCGSGKGVSISTITEEELKKRKELGTKYVVRRPSDITGWCYFDYSVENHIGDNLQQAAVFDDVEDAIEERNSMSGVRWEVVPYKEPETKYVIRRSFEGGWIYYCQSESHGWNLSVDIAHALVFDTHKDAELVMEDLANSNGRWEVSPYVPLQYDPKDVALNQPKDEWRRVYNTPLIEIVIYLNSDYKHNESMYVRANLNKKEITAKIDKEYGTQGWYSYDIMERDSK